MGFRGGEDWLGAEEGFGGESSCCCESHFCVIEKEDLSEIW